MHSYIFYKVSPGRRAATDEGKTTGEQAFNTAAAEGARPQNSVSEVNKQKEGSEDNVSRQHRGVQVL